MNRIVDAQYKHSVKIPVTTLNKLCKDKDISVLKIDVEGYEKFVLEGSKSLLDNKTLNVVIIEINFSNSFYGVKNEDISELLMSNGFTPYEYNPIERELKELKTYNKKQFNTIFIRNLKVAKNRLKNSDRIKFGIKRSNQSTNFNNYKSILLRISLGKSISIIASSFRFSIFKIWFCRVFLAWLHCRVNYLQNIFQIFF